MIFITAPIIIYNLSIFIFINSIILIINNNIYIIEWEIICSISNTIKIQLIIEWSSIMYSSIVIFISANVLKFSQEYIKIDQNKNRFTFIVLLFVISINFLIFIPNIITILIGWDGLGATSFILIIYYNNARSLRAGILTIITNRLGDTFILLAIILIIDTGDWLLIHTTTNNKYFLIQCLRITIAATTKRAQIPFSRWLPAAIAAPTPVSALVHSSTLVTAGIFILYRFNYIISSSTTAQTTLTIIGLLTALTIRIRAIYENDIKKIIALSTLRQLGLITLSISFNISILTFFHISTHAIFKALLFITAGCLIINNNHNQDLRIYGQYSYTRPVITSSILISLTAIAGVPSISGYYSKHLIIEWSYRTPINIFIIFILLITILLTSIYSLRLILFTTIIPALCPKIFKHHVSYNNILSLVIMTLSRIFSGTILNWLLPYYPTNYIIAQNINKLNSTYIIILTITITTLIITSKKITYTNLSLYKLLSSLLFLTPISTQTFTTPFIKFSTLTYKHLDQTWLEKLTTIRHTNQLYNSRLSLNTYIQPLSLKILPAGIVNRIIYNYTNIKLHIYI